MKKRIYSLDLLKFCLAIIIALMHFQQQFGGGILATGKFRSYYAVDLFFVISGFFSMSALKKTNESMQQENFSSYFIHKCIRIYPMAMLSVLFFLCCSAVYKVCYGVWFQNIVPGLWKLLNSLLLTKGGPIIFDIPFNYPLWYLGVLLICYAIAYFIFYISRQKNISYITLYILTILAGISIYCNGINIPYLNCFSSRGYCAFFLGGLLNVFYYKCENLRKKALLLSIICVILCVSAGVINFNLFYDDEFCQWGVATFLLSPSIVIIFLEIDKWFKAKWWSLLGGLSFEIYLWHASLLLLFACLKQKVPAVAELNYNIQMTIFIAAVIFFSYLMYVLCEKTLYARCSAFFEKYLEKKS
ncbi:MAG: acyltransferase [Treponemataceae bacterium]|nr:acyltransferase [Treponemataceae bacterium]